MKNYTKKELEAKIIELRDWLENHRAVYYKGIAETNDYGWTEKTKKLFEGKYEATLDAVSQLNKIIGDR